MEFNQRPCVCATKVRTLQALQGAIVAKKQRLSVALCQRIFQSVPERLQLYKD
jgi:hypothetical protein